MLTSCHRGVYHRSAVSPPSRGGGRQGAPGREGPPLPQPGSAALCACIKGTSVLKFEGAKCSTVGTTSRFQGQCLAGNLSAVRAVRRLTHLRCRVVPGRDSSSSAGSVRRVPSLHSAVRVQPGCNSSRPFRHSTCAVLAIVFADATTKLRSVLVPGRKSLPGIQDTAVPAVGASCTHRYQEFRGIHVSTPSAGGHASASKPGTPIRRSVPVRGNRRAPHQRHLALTPLGRSGPGPGGRLPSHNVVLFRCFREPCVSFPRRSRARRPSRCQTASRATLHSLRSFRALGHWETLSRASAWIASRRRTTSPASTTRLRDSQQPRLTKRLPLPPHQEIHWHHPPDGDERGINIYNGR